MGQNSSFKSSSLGPTYIVPDPRHCFRFLGCVFWVAPDCVELAAWLKVGATEAILRRSISSSSSRLATSRGASGEGKQPQQGLPQLEQCQLFPGSTGSRGLGAGEGSAGSKCRFRINPGGDEGRRCFFPSVYGGLCRGLCGRFEACPRIWDVAELFISCSSPRAASKGLICAAERMKRLRG